MKKLLFIIATATFISCGKDTPPSKQQQRDTTVIRLYDPK